MRNFSVLLWTYFVCGQAIYAQTTFQKTWGGPLNDAANDINATSDGNYIIVGNTYNSKLNCDNILLMKVNNMGDTLWTKVYGNSGGQRGINAKETNDNGFIVTGIGSGALAIDTGGGDIILIKTDLTGNILWGKVYGGKYYEEPVDILIMDDGGYLIAGATESYGLMDINYCDPASFYFCSHIYLIRTNSSGDTLWTKVINTAKAETIEGIIKSKDGNYYIVGKTWSFTNLTTSLLLKVDTNGNLLWSKVYPYRFTEARGVIEKEDGDLILMGNGYWGNFLYTQGVIIAETDNSGNLKWIKITDNGNDTTSASENITDFSSDGNYIYIVGGTNSFNIADSIYITSHLIKMDFSGNIQNIKGYAIGGGGYYISQSINSNIFMLCGPTYTLGEGNSDVFTFSTDSLGNSDCNTYNINLSMVNIDPATIQVIDTGFVVGNTNTIVMDYPLQQGYPQLEMMDCDDFQKAPLYPPQGGTWVSVYPNPGHGIFALRLNGSAQQNITSVCIYNVLGEEILVKHKINSTSTLVNMTREHSGVYFVKVTAGDPDSYREMFFRKIIIQE